MVCDNRRGYESFETSVQELVCKPLKGIYTCFIQPYYINVSLYEAILSRYDVLSATADDEALRELLKQLKQDAPQVYNYNHRGGGVLIAVIKELKILQLRG